MCTLCFLAKLRGITLCFRSQVPVSLFHVPKGRICPNSAYRRWLTSPFSSGVQLQRCNVGRFVLEIGMKACPLPTDLAFTIAFGSVRLGSFLPVKRSLPLCILLLCFAIFSNSCYSPILFGRFPSLSAIGVASDQTIVRLLTAQGNLTGRTT